MTDKEKLNLITQYFYSGSFIYENDIILSHNSNLIKNTVYSTLDLFEKKIRYDTFCKISKDIEKILFD